MNKRFLLIILFCSFCGSILPLPVKADLVVFQKEEIKDPELAALAKKYMEVKYEGQNLGGGILIGDEDPLFRYLNRPLGNPLTEDEIDFLKPILTRALSDYSVDVEALKADYIKTHPNNPGPASHPDTNNQSDEQRESEEKMLELEAQQTALKEKISKQPDGPTDEDNAQLKEVNAQLNAFQNQLTQPQNSQNNNLNGVFIKSQPKEQTIEQTPCSFSVGTNPFYCMLAPVPIFTDDSLGRVQISPAGFTRFLNNLVKFALAVATGLAVVMIVIGGVQYASTDAMFDKSEGKTRIQQALSGLFLALMSYVILNTVNPDVFDTRLNIETVDFEPIGFDEEFLRQVEQDEALSESELAHSGPITNPTAEFIPPVGADLSAFPGIQSYVGKTFTARDNSGRTGQMIYQVAYLKDWAPSRWGNLRTISTFRSSERNSQVGGSRTSDHLRGAAIDLAPASGNQQSPAFQSDGYAMLEYMKQYGHIIGIDQIIFREQNWRFQGGKWVRGGQVSGHYNHIHIGFQ